MLLHTYQVFSSLVGDLHFFCAFFLQFYGVIFFGHPIPGGMACSWGLRGVAGGSSQGVRLGVVNNYRTPTTYRVTHSANQN